MKTAMITGSNRGLGLTLLKRFAREGFNIIAHSRKKNDEWTRQCAEMESAYNVSIKNVFFDLTKKDEVEQGLRQLAEDEVQIDVLINNAGILTTKPLMYVSYEDLEATFMVNYFSLAIITKEIGSIMMHGDGGCIINISSCMGEGHQPGGACYDASKAAVNQFTRSIAQEFSPFGIRVNAISGGIIDTDMFENLSDKQKSKMIKATALKRPAEMEEIADSVVFLASDKASYITGTILNVEGGAII